jgi:hypothetical protein
MITKNWGALMAALAAGFSFKSKYRGGNLHAFYGVGNRQHRGRRATPAQRYHRAKK